MQPIRWESGLLIFSSPNNSGAPQQCVSILDARLKMVSEQFKLGHYEPEELISKTDAAKSG